MSECEDCDLLQEQVRDLTKRVFELEQRFKYSVSPQAQDDFRSFYNSASTTIGQGFKYG